MSGPNARVALLGTLGRSLIAAFFIVAGVGLIGDFSGATAMMSAKGIPQPQALLVVVIVVWFVGGAGLLRAPTRRHAALLLLAGTVIVTLLIHDFWTAAPAQMPNELQHFLANVAICGGLLGIASK